MQENQHWAIFSSELSMKSDFIQNLLKGIVPDFLNELKGKRGVLFSTFTLEQFEKEEAIHDNYTLSEKEQRSIRTFSSGEQRKALLNYLISLKPDFFIFDNTFDMLDLKSQEILKHRLIELSQQIPILQIVKRKDNLLPFIKNVLRVENECIHFTGTFKKYQELYKDQDLVEIQEKLPFPLEKIIPQKNPLIQFKNVTVDYGDRAIVRNIN